MKGLARAFALTILLLACPDALAEPWTLTLLQPNDMACPDRESLTAALERRGGRVLDSGAAFTLEIGAGGLGASIVLSDGAGQVLAERQMETADCVALADAIALLVERRVQGIAWEGELPGVRTVPSTTALSTTTPSEPARLRFELQPEAGVVFGTDLEDRGGRLGPSVGLRVLSPWLVELALSVGWFHHSDVPIADAGSLAVDRVPIALEGGVSLRRKHWELHGGVRGQVDVLTLESSELPRSSRRTRVAASIGPTVSLSVSPSPGVWIALAGTLLVKAVGYDMVVEGFGTVAREAPVSVDLGLHGGYRFSLGE